MNQEIIKLLEEILKPLDACEPQCKLNLKPEKIRRVIALLKAEQPPASAILKISLFEALDRLDASEASRKELVEAFKELAATFVGLPEGSIGGQAMKKANDVIEKQS